MQTPTEQCCWRCRPVSRSRPLRCRSPRITIPRRCACSDCRDRRSGIRNPAMLSQLISPRIKAAKILIVDDEHYMRKVTRTILTAIGVKTIMEAPDAMAGLETARNNCPDLIIVDWEMPLI